MYAVIKTGGKQHKVKVGDVIEVEKLVHEGETLTFQPLMVVDDDGKAHVGEQAAKAVVTARPLGEQKGEKVKVFKYRPKSGYKRSAGHRQLLTLLEIEGVTMGGAKKAAAKKADAGVDEDAAENPAPKEATAARPAAKKAPAKKPAAKKPTAKTAAE